jgi:phage tail sheath protein FI
MTFLHGVKFTEVLTRQLIQGAGTSIIGLVGTASKFTLADQTDFPATNAPILVNSLSQGIELFGTEGPSGLYTIPAALNAIFQQGPAVVVVSNVLDTTTFLATVADEAATLNTTTNKVSLAHEGVDAVVVRSDNLATNGTFASDVSWSKGTGWSIAGSVAASDGSQSAASELAQNTTGVSGKTYRLTYTLTRSAGTIVPKLGGTSGSSRATAGTFTENIVCGATASAPLVFEADADFVGSVDTVSLQRVYVLTTDYTVNAVTGEISRVLTGAITSGQTLNVSYTWLDPATIVAADIVGTVVAGVRTGAQCWLDASNLLGYEPKILIAPGYNTATVVDGLDVLASSLKAVWVSDVTAGQTVAQALTTRSSGNVFNTATRRGWPVYPHLVDGDGVTRPGSAYIAGAMANLDLTKGFWYSPSNVEIQGVASLERAISFQLDDATCDANVLNAQGIQTFATGYGLGIRSWGNRNLSYPSSSDPLSFIAGQRIQDMLWRSIQVAALNYMDLPGNQAAIDSVRAAVNAFIRELVGKGALVGGECTYDPARNPSSQTGAGHYVFGLRWMFPPPMEQIEFEDYVDVTILDTLA